jgi:hypothetical protein
VFNTAFFSCDCLKVLINRLDRVITFRAFQLMTENTCWNEKVVFREANMQRILDQRCRTHLSNNTHNPYMPKLYQMLKRYLQQEYCRECMRAVLNCRLHSEHIIRWHHASVCRPPSRLKSVCVCLFLEQWRKERDFVSVFIPHWM